MMPKQILTLLCLLCVMAAASAQTEVKDSLGVDTPQANTPAALLKGRVSGVLVTATDGTLDKTWQEIADADVAVIVFAGDDVYHKEFVTTVSFDEKNESYDIDVLPRGLTFSLRFFVFFKHLF